MNAGADTSTHISDSVVKEFTQNQATDNRSAAGANVAGGISIVMGDRSGGAATPSSAELSYEEHILTILHGGGTLDRARPKLNEIRRQLGLTLRAAQEIERACSLGEDPSQATARPHPMPTAEDSHAPQDEDSFSALIQTERGDREHANTQPSDPEASAQSAEAAPPILADADDILDFLHNSCELDFEQAEAESAALARELSAEQFEALKAAFEWAWSGDGPECKTADAALALAKGLVARYSPKQFELFKAAFEWTWSGEGPECKTTDQALDMAARLVAQHSAKQFTALKAAFEWAWSGDGPECKTAHQALEMATRLITRHSPDQFELLKVVFEWTWSGDGPECDSTEKALDLANDLVARYSAAEFEVLRTRFEKARDEYDRTPEEALEYAKRSLAR